MRYYDKLIINIYIKHLETPILYKIIGEFSKYFTSEKAVIDLFENYFAYDKKRCENSDELHIRNNGISKSLVKRIFKNHRYYEKFLVLEKYENEILKEYKKVIYEENHEKLGHYMSEKEILDITEKVISKVDFVSISKHAENLMLKWIYSEYKFEIYSRMTIDEIYKLFGDDSLTLDNVKQTMEAYIEERKLKTYAYGYRAGLKLANIEIIHNILNAIDMNVEDAEVSMEEDMKLIKLINNFSKGNLEKIVHKDMEYMCNLTGCDEVIVLKYIN